MRFKKKGSTTCQSSLECVKVFYSNDSGVFSDILYIFWDPLIPFEFLDDLGTPDIIKDSLDLKDP